MALLIIGLGGDFEEDLTHIRQNNPYYTELMCSGLSLENIQDLAEALKVNTSINRVDISFGKIGAAGAVSIAEALKVNKSIISIDLRDNEIGDVGAASIAEALKVNKSIIRVYLGINEIGDVGAAYIADALKVNRRITMLDLEGNQIRDEGAAFIVEALKVNRKITILDLEGNQIGDEDAASIAKFLEANVKYSKNLFGHLLLLVTESIPGLSRYVPVEIGREEIASFLGKNDINNLYLAHKIAKVDDNDGSLEQSLITLEPNKNPGNPGCNDDFSYVINLKEKLSKPLDSQAFIYKANIGFKVFDAVIDTARLIKFPTIANAKNLLIDITYINSIYYGANGVSTIINGMDIVDKLYQGEYGKAIAQGLITTGSMLFPVAISFIATPPHIGFIYGAALTIYSGYSVITNAYSFYQEYMEIIELKEEERSDHYYGYNEERQILDHVVIIGED